MTSTDGGLNQMARELYARSSMNWKVSTKWDDLPEETRQAYRSWVVSVELERVRQERERSKDA